jgi:hypothetical protein
MINDTVSLISVLFTPIFWKKCQALCNSEIGLLETQKLPLEGRNLRRVAKEFSASKGKTWPATTRQ